MAAKDVKFSSDAREKMLRGVDILVTADAMIADAPKRDGGAPAMPGGGMDF